MDHSVAGLANVILFKIILEFLIKNFKLIFSKSDYKMDGIDQLICCSVEGEVRGYKAMPSDILNMTSDRNINQETIRDMAQRKQVN